MFVVRTSVVIALATAKPVALQQEAVLTGAVKLRMLEHNAAPRLDYVTELRSAME